MRIVIAEGITGGFVPAIIKRQATFQSTENHLEIESHILVPGSLLDYKSESKIIDLDLTSISQYVDKFKHLPIPLPGSHDFYGLGLFRLVLIVLDVGISIDDEGSSPFRWENSVHGGCDSTGEDEDGQVIPSEVDKAVFKDFAEFLLGLAFTG
jgi:hypothetical protein